VQAALQVSIPCHSPPRQPTSSPLRARLCIVKLPQVYSTAIVLSTKHLTSIS
jgi:hypothetical protein